MYITKSNLYCALGVKLFMRKFNSFCRQGSFMRIDSRFEHAFRTLLCRLQAEVLPYYYFIIVHHPIRDKIPIDKISTKCDKIDLSAWWSSGLVHTDVHLTLRDACGADGVPLYTASLACILGHSARMNKDADAMDQRQATMPKSLGKATGFGSETPASLSQGLVPLDKSTVWGDESRVWCLLSGHESTRCAEGWSH